MKNAGLDIQQEISVPLPIKTVWDYLVNQDGLKVWFGAEHFVIDPYQGGQISIPFSRGDDTIQVVGDTGLLITYKKLVFTWIERDSKGKEWFYPTLVTIEFNEVDDGTRIRISHSGFQRLPSGIRDDVIERYKAFWRDESRLEKLHASLLAASGG